MSDRAPRSVVEAYCGRRSYLPGDELTVHCSTPTPRFSVEIARVGGTREVVWGRDDIAGEVHPVPERAYATGCDWPDTVALRIPEDWRSGFYEIALLAEGLATGHAGFVVRSAHPGRDASIVLGLSTNTYNAYNRWGGECLYTGATHVSFERPLEPGYVVKPVEDDGYDGRFAATGIDGDPDHVRLDRYLARHRMSMWTSSAGWWNWERRFVRWAEATGHRIDVAVNSDLEEHPDVLRDYRLFVSVGHDEYWSWAMRDTLDDFVDRGGNAAFFSGNSVLWQVRFQDDGRTMVCYRGHAHERDPVLETAKRERMSGLWSDPLTGRPENSTTGLSFWRGGYVRIGHAVPRGSGAYTVYRPEHWVFEGTGLAYGDLLGAASRPVGYEVDGCEFTLDRGRPIPTYEDGTPHGFTILGTTPARLISITDEVCEAPPRFWASVDPPGDLEFGAMRLFGDASPEHIAELAHNHAVMGVFTRGGTVFHAGTADWAYGLDDDPLVQRVTANVLGRLSQG